VYRRWLWPSLSFPGVLWLVLLFVVPFYAVLGVALGTVDPVLFQPVPIWNPLQWNVGWLTEVINRLAPGGIWFDVGIRTIVYVAISLALCLLIGYPVAYYTARHAGRWKGVILILIILPLWISYMMRMLAWVNLLQANGYVNRFLLFTHVLSQPRDWLGGSASTVIFALVYGYIPYLILPLFASLDRIDRSHLEAARDLGASQWGAHHPPDVRRLLHAEHRLRVAEDLHDRESDRPLLPRWAATDDRRRAHDRAGRVPDDPDALLHVEHPPRPARGRGGGRAVTAVAEPRAQTQPSAFVRLRGWIRNPWGKPRFLVVFTWAYILWSIVPVLIAVQFSFNATRSRTVWDSFSTRWYWGDPVDSVWHDPTLRHALLQSFKLAGADVLIAVPIGVLLALGLARWHGRGSGTSNFIMLFPLVTPEIVMGVALLLVFTQLFTFIHTGTFAQILGHVTFSISFVVVIVRGRLFSIGRQYEEAAADLGASPFVALTRVLLPLLTPAIVASAAVVFAISADDFVISQWLSKGGPTDTVPIQIYAATRAAPLPSVNAIATIMMISTLIIVAAGFLVWRVLTSGERRAGKSAEDFGGAFNLT
jgi:spermidine/putrescine transport system permease protein